MTEDLFDYEFDGSGFTPEDLDQKGSATVNKNGFYHILIKGLHQEKQEGKIPAIRVDMEVLAGENEDQVGRTHYHRVNLAKWNEDKTDVIPLSEASVKNVLRFFTNLGLVPKEEAVGNRVRLPWERLDQFQAIVEIKNEPYEDKETKKMKDSFKIPFGCNVWKVGDERMSKVPKDPDALADFTGGAGLDSVDDI